MLISSLNVDQEELRKNFRFLSRVSQPDEVDEFLSLDLEENQMELLSWLQESTEKGKSPLVLLEIPPPIGLMKITNKKCGL